MKRIFVCFAVALMTLSMSAASFGILVNGKMYYEGTKTDEFEGFTQYLAHVPFKNGDYFQLYDGDNKVAWVKPLSTHSVTGFSYDEANGKYHATVTGCYDCYIKIKENQDELYIGNGSNCGEGTDISGQGGEVTPPVTPGGEDEDDADFYVIGWINGADHGETAWDVFEDDYLIEDGKITIDCTMGSYICIKDHMGNFYRSKTPTTIADTQVTFDWQNGWSGGEKWAIPQGINYIIIRSASFKGQIKLERVDKATYDAYHYGTQGFEQTVVNAKARKMIIDGQLRIVRGDKIFDATGRQL